MRINHIPKILKNYPYVIPEQAPLVILDSKPDLCMAKNSIDTKHTRKFSGRMHFVGNGEDWDFHKTVLCERGLHMAYIETNIVREDQLNPKLGHAMLILDNLPNTCIRGVIGYRRVWIIIYYEWFDWIELSILLNEFEMFIWVYNDELEFRMTKITLKLFYKTVWKQRQ